MPLVIVGIAVGCGVIVAAVAVVVAAAVAAYMGNQTSDLLWG